MRGCVTGTGNGNQLLMSGGGVEGGQLTMRTARMSIGGVTNSHLVEGTSKGVYSSDNNKSGRELDPVSKEQDR